MKWRTEDISALREAYAQAGSNGPVRINALALELGRSKGAVCKKAVSFGLTTRFRTRPKEEMVNYSARAKEQLSRNGHPRGMAGKQHSSLFREKLSNRMRATVSEGNHPWQRKRTQADRQRMAETTVRQMKTGAREMYSRCRRGKRADLEGQFFRSAWEANYARFLNLQKAQRLIVTWEYEADTFWFEAIRRGVRSYTPDFKITEPNGHVFYIEVKGWMDAKSVTKMKRMKKYHPAVDLRLFDAKAYRELARKLGPALPGWEP